MLSDLLLPILLSVVGCFLLAYGADWLVVGSSQLARRLGVSSLVIGLTVVAFGTSSPELVTSLLGGSTIATGNVLGSNLINLGLILGITALIAPLACGASFLRFELPVLVALGPVAWWLARDGVYSRAEGWAMIGALVVVTAISVWRGRTERDPKVIAELEEMAGGGTGAASLGWSLWLVGAGLAALVGGGQALVSGAQSLAAAVGIPERIIALTLVAGGTSLPELATCVVAARKGEGDIALGNIVGSNIMNILAIFGIVAATRSIEVPAASLAFDFPAVTLMQFLCVPIMLTRLRVSRIEGGVLLAAYGAYLVLLARG